jgi:hypothetical protein
MTTEETVDKFKIKITQHGEPLGPVRWWYWNHIGQEFEAWLDPKRESYYYVDASVADGNSRPHHVLKTDCEVLTSPQATVSTESPNEVEAV